MVTENERMCDPCFHIQSHCRPPFPKSKYETIPEEEEGSNREDTDYYNDIPFVSVSSTLPLKINQPPILHDNSVEQNIPSPSSIPNIFEDTTTSPEAKISGLTPILPLVSSSHLSTAVAPDTPQSTGEVGGPGPNAEPLSSLNAKSIYPVAESIVSNSNSSDDFSSSLDTLYSSRSSLKQHSGDEGEPIDFELLEARKLSDCIVNLKVTGVSMLIHNIQDSLQKMMNKLAKHKEVLTLGDTIQYVDTFFHTQTKVLLMYLKTCPKELLQSNPSCALPLASDILLQPSAHSFPLPSFLHYIQSLIVYFEFHKVREKQFTQFALEFGHLEEQCTLVKDILRQHTRNNISQPVKVIELDPLNYAVSKSRYTGNPLQVPGEHFPGPLKVVTQGTMTLLTGAKLQQIIERKGNSDLKEEFLKEKDTWIQKEKEYFLEIAKLKSKVKNLKTKIHQFQSNEKKQKEEISKQSTVFSKRVNAQCGSDQVLGQCINSYTQTIVEIESVELKRNLDFELQEKEKTKQELLLTKLRLADAAQQIEDYKRRLEETKEEILGSKKEARDVSIKLRLETNHIYDLENQLNTLKQQQNLHQMHVNQLNQEKQLLKQSKEDLEKSMSGLRDQMAQTIQTQDTISTQLHSKVLEYNELSEAHHTYLSKSFSEKQSLEALLHEKQKECLFQEEENIVLHSKVSSLEQLIKKKTKEADKAIEELSKLENKVISMCRNDNSDIQTAPFQDPTEFSIYSEDWDNALRKQIDVNNLYIAVMEKKNHEYRQNRMKRIAYLSNHRLSMEIHQTDQFLMSNDPQHEVERKPSSNSNNRKRPFSAPPKRVGWVLSEEHGGNNSLFRENDGMSNTPSTSHPGSVPHTIVSKPAATSSGVVMAKQLNSTGVIGIPIQGTSRTSSPSGKFQRMRPMSASSQGSTLYESLSRPATSLSSSRPTSAKSVHSDATLLDSKSSPSSKLHKQFIEKGAVYYYATPPMVSSRPATPSVHDYSRSNKGLAESRPPSSSSSRCPSPTKSALKNKHIIPSSIVYAIPEDSESTPIYSKQTHENPTYLMGMCNEALEQVKDTVPLPVLEKKKPAEVIQLKLKMSDGSHWESSSAVIKK